MIFPKFCRNFLLTTLLRCFVPGQKRDKKFLFKVFCFV